MRATGLEVFDQTLQKTNIWLKEIMEQLGRTGKGPTTLSGPRSTPCAIA